MDNPESPGLGSSLSDLEAENRQLKEQLERMKADLSVQLMQMNERSEKIMAQVGAYTPLVEDVLGLRVFDKAKSYLISWITLGGTTALIASIALFAGAWKYAVDLIDTKIKTLSEEQVGEIVKKEAETQVAKYFKDHNDEYIGHVEQMTEQFIQRTNTAVQSKLGYGGSTIVEEGQLTAVTKTASMVDYTQQMGNVRTQGAEGSVVGFAIAYTLEYQILRTAGQHVRLSPREIYNLTRRRDNSLESDSGATISDGVKTVQTEGVVLEDIWPYKAGEYSAQAPKEFITAERYRIKRARKLNNLEEIKAALLDTGPIVGGITLYQSFITDEVNKTGLVPVPKAKERVLGGHAVCIVGYDDVKKRLKFINSWGDDWGEHGYGYLPYDYVKDNLADMWALSL